MYRERRTAWGPRVAAVAFGVAAMLLDAGAAATEPPTGCTEEGRVLKVGFYHDFAPVSFSADRDSGSAGFHQHRGYEADLLTALEATGAARFSRRAVGGAFAGIWLKAATPEYDLVGGGITIREDRIRDPRGQEVVVFTSGHIAFVQTLLVRAEDAGRFAGYRGLSPEVRIAAVPGTTGEERLLQLTGYVGPDGAVRPGTRVHLASGEVLGAGGGERLAITAASSSPVLEDRRRARGRHALPDQHRQAQTMSIPRSGSPTCSPASPKHRRPARTTPALELAGQPPAQSARMVETSYPRIVAGIPAPGLDQHTLRTRRMLAFAVTGCAIGVNGTTSASSWIRHSAASQGSDGIGAFRSIAPNDRRRAATP